MEKKKKIEEYEFVELTSLGWELLPESRTTVVWECYDTNSFGHTLIEETISNDLIGQIYYEFLFEAFINTP